MIKPFISFLLILLCNIIIVSSAGENNQKETNLFKDFNFENIIWLDDTNCTSEIEKQELLYIVFYLSDDKNCLQYMPEFLRTSKLAEEEQLPLKFGKIDLAKSPNIANQYEIKYVPSIILFHKGDRHVYQDENGASEKLLKFMFKKAYDGIYKVETNSQIKEFMDSSRLVLLSTLKDENLLLYQSFVKNAKTILNIDFVSCITDECIKEYGEDLYLFKQFDERKNRFSTDFMKINDANMYSIKQFLSYYAVEAGGSIDQFGINMINDNKKSILIYFRKSSVEEQTQHDITIKEVGIELRAKEVYTAIADLEINSFHQSLASEFGVEKEALPTLIFYDISNNDLLNIYMVKSVNSKDLTKEAIKQYIEGIQKSGKLKYVTKENYNKEIIEEKKNVVLTLADETSSKPENNKLLTLMRNLAKKYNPEEYNIIFSYMDTSKNPPPGIDIKNEDLPLILIYKKAGDKQTVIKIQFRDFENLTEEAIENQLYETLYKEINNGADL